MYEIVNQGMIRQNNTEQNRTEQNRTEEDGKKKMTIKKKIKSITIRIKKYVT